MATMGMAIDLRRCAGCYACVVACQMHNNTKPGVAWGHVDAKEWGEDPDNRRCYLPHACMHCEDAPCVKVCPTGASYVREDGIVMVDYDQCINCGSCLHACPFGADVQNDVEGNFFDTAEQAPYEAEGIQRTQVVEKCIFCAGRVDAGLQPACVQNCPGNARVFGDLDDPESPISAFLAKDGVVRVGDTHFYYVPWTACRRICFRMPKCRLWRIRAWTPSRPRRASRSRPLSARWRLLRRRVRASASA